MSTTKKAKVNSKKTSNKTSNKATSKATKKATSKEKKVEKKKADYISKIFTTESGARYYLRPSNRKAYLPKSDAVLTSKLDKENKNNHIDEKTFKKSFISHAEAVNRILKVSNKISHLYKACTEKTVQRHFYNSVPVFKLTEINALVKSIEIENKSKATEKKAKAKNTEKTIKNNVKKSKSNAKKKIKVA